MNWIFAGFGFALGMWLFAVALRWAMGHASALLGIAKWTVIVLAFSAVVALAFSWSVPAGISVASLAVVWLVWLALNALPPVTSPSRPPTA